MQTEPAPAFFSALRDGDTVTVRTLLSTADAQSWINYQSDLGYTPLYIAALLNQPSITEQLIVVRSMLQRDRVGEERSAHKETLLEILWCDDYQDSLHGVWNSGTA
jgi:hypothetical protein